MIPDSNIEWYIDLIDHLKQQNQELQSKLDKANGLLIEACGLMAYFDKGGFHGEYFNFINKPEIKELSGNTGRLGE